MNKYTKTFEIKDFSFSYAGSEKNALRDVNFSVEYGEFITLCGATGSGKSTLLRQFKTVLAPEGIRKGSIDFYGRDLNRVSLEEQTRRVGFVLQDIENQIVTDKVWHELAFGLENLGVETNIIRIRVAEMATFFGITPWIDKDVSELSGGQKQLLNLASVMTFNPDVLILDEPTSYLDPIASEEFIDTLAKINKEIGTTVIISEHNLNQVMPVSDRVVVMEEGKITADSKPENIGNIISENNMNFINSLPAPLQIYIGLKGDLSDNKQGPITVRDGRTWLTDVFAGKQVTVDTISDKNSEEFNKKYKGTDTAKGKNDENEIKLKDIRFKYGKDAHDVIKNLDCQIRSGSITTIVGGNGSGKSTLIKIIGRLLKPYRGKVTDKGKKMALLPQNPQVLFVTDSVKRELEEVTKDIDGICSLMELNHLRYRHPYDLSGGEQQRLALAKILLTDADVLLLDEPTTGLDGSNRKLLGDILTKLSEQGKTILMVSHNLEFASQYSDQCLLLFDGQIMSQGSPGEFFPGNRFYTTGANRMSRHIFTNAVTADDVIELCKINLKADHEQSKG